MKEELEKKLLEKYPKIIQCGLAIGDGWYFILDTLCMSLQSDTDNNRAPQVRAVQIKEKFGGLRFYVDGGNEKQYGMIWLAEAMAGRTCEKCGTTKDVKRRGKSWVKTLCGKCNEEW